MVDRGRMEDVFGTRFDFLEPDEEALARFRPSRRLMIAEVTQQAFGLLITLLAAVLVYRYAQSHGDPALAQGALVVIASFLGIDLIFIVQRLVRAGLEIYFTEYVITDRRTYSVTAIFGRRMNAIPFEKVTNLGIRRNFFERLIHVDGIRLTAYGMKGARIDMRGVQETEDVFRRLQRLVRAESTAEGLLRAD